MAGRRTTLRLLALLAALGATTWFAYELVRVREVPAGEESGKPTG